MTVRYRTAPTVPSGAVTQPTRRRDGPPHCLLHGLASDGVCTAHDVTAMPVVSYTAIPPLLRHKPKRYYFCCTIHGVTPSGRYPASCPVKPGLSSHAYFPACAAERTAKAERTWFFQVRPSFVLKRFRWFNEAFQKRGGGAVGATARSYRAVGSRSFCSETLSMV